MLLNMSDSDLDLLRQFTRDRVQDAFTELVNRHLNLVYSAALRLVRSPQLAEDVAQSVFADLARHADKIRPDTALVAWLHAVTRHTAVDVIRKESRRQMREQLAYEMNITNAPDANWQQIEPFLDEAVAELDETDRAAVLLRYFENKSLRDVGQQLGVSDEAAQKRVSRAVELLREFFAKRGVTVGAGGLVVAISANAVQAAPVGLAVTISAAALAGTAVTTSTLIAATTKTIAMTTLQKTLVTATVAVLAGAGVYQAKQAHDARTQVQKLQQQQTPLIEQIQQLQNNFAAATNRLADLLAENKYLKSNPHEMELLRLRGQVTQLKAVETEDQNDPTMAAAKSWAERVALLKQRFAAWSGKKTPEIELLTEQDWLDVAAKHQLESEDDYRDAMSDIRTAAIEEFAGLVKTATKQYAETNNGQLPSSPSQLIPFLNLSSDLATTILNGYEIAKPGTVHPPNPGPSESEVTSWAMLQKDGPADPEYDHTFVLYTGGWYFYGPNKVK